MSLAPEERIREAGFVPVDAPHPSMFAYVNGDRGISLIVTSEMHDGKRWIHLSIAGMTGTPMWNDLIGARDAVLGSDKKAIQILPPKKEHVNLHPTCFHLFHCLDGDPLPDFTRGKGIL